MKEEGPNVGARVRVKLLRLAKEHGDDFQLVLLRYVRAASVPAGDLRSFGEPADVGTRFRTRQVTPVETSRPLDQGALRW